MKRSVRAAARMAVVTVGLFAACTSSGPRPGTGDVSFRLLWNDPADLDLHVVDPAERHVGMFPFTSSMPTDEQYAMRVRQAELEETVSAPPGVLDVDCNASPAESCSRPMENVYWPEGTALRGRYRVWVQLFQKLHDGREVPFVLEVRRGETVAETFRGVLSDAMPRSEDFEVEY